MVRSSRLALLALFLAAPACSKKKEGAPSNKPAEPTTGAASTTAAADTPAAAAASPCDAAPAALVSEVLGQPGFASSRTETQGTVTVCEYERSGKPRSLTLRIETGAAAWDTYKEQVKEYAVKDLPGLGDKAYQYTMGGSGDQMGQNVVLLKGDNILQLSQLGGDTAKLAALGGRIAAALH
jgi:hypothetical protein